MTSSWADAILGDILTLQRGYDLPNRDRIDGAIPIVSSSGVTGKHNVSKVKGPGVVTGRYGTLGEVFFVKEDYWPLNTTLYVKDFKGNDPLFLSYFLKTLNLAQQNTAGAVPGLNRNALHLLPVRVPYLETQRKIASILSAYDDLIENNTRRIKILEEMARMIYREWFVNFRFPGHEKVKMVDSPLGMIPEGWEVRDLLDLSEVTYGFAFKADQFSVEQLGKPVIRIRDVLEGRSSTYSTEKAADKFLVQNGDVLVGMDGDFHMGFWVGGEAYLVQRVARFRSKGDISNYHLFLAMERPIQDFNATITGTTVAHLGDKHIKTIQVAWPDTTLLAKANQVFDSMLKQILTLRLKNQNLRQTRDLLLPKLISGEVAV